MQIGPTVREPVPRNSLTPPRSSTKSPTQTRYSHLLYLTAPERQLYVSKMERFSDSSIRSSQSVRSSRSNSSSAMSQTSAPTSYTSKFSIQTPRYVDDHYPLITTIHPELVPASVPQDHAALYCARQMAQMHNTIIRALNASWNHSVRVQPDTQEASEFLLFNQQLCKMMDRHHRFEHDHLFPAIQKLLKCPDEMEEISIAHGSFAERLVVFHKYVSITKAAEYNGVTFRHIIESFAPDLIQQLHDEIPTLMNLHVSDSKALMRLWKRFDHLAIKNNSLYTDTPWLLGCQDKSFAIDGDNCDFPHLSWATEAVVRTWHSKRHAGAWRFCPSDLYGQRRLLTVV